MTAARILVAVLAEPLPTVKKALAGYWLVVRFAIDLFVIGILFDDPRAMELIRMIRLDITRHATPILMVPVDTQSARGDAAACNADDDCARHCQQLR